jgi:hypothetical protein
MEMDFVDINEDYFATAHAFVEGLKLFDELCPLGRVCLGQQFLAPFPTQARRTQKAAGA